MYTETMKDQIMKKRIFWIWLFSH